MTLRLIIRLLLVAGLACGYVYATSPEALLSGTRCDRSLRFDTYSEAIRAPASAEAPTGVDAAGVAIDAAGTGLLATSPRRFVDGVTTPACAAASPSRLHLLHSVFLI